MKTHDLVLLILFFSTVTCYVCQSGEYEDPFFAATSLSIISSTTKIISTCAATDKGNSFFGAIVQGTITIGSVSAAPIAANDEMMLVKYNSTNAVQWIRRFGGVNSISTVKSMAVDTNGNVYFAGSITGAVSFDNVNMTSFGSNKANSVLVKLNGSNGNVVWATSPVQNTASCLNTAVHSIEVVSDTIVATLFASGTFAIGSSNYSMGTNSALLISTHNTSTGEVLTNFAIAHANSDVSQTSKLSTANSNNYTGTYFIVSGRFQHQATFFSINGKNTTLNVYPSPFVNNTNEDVFLAVYHSNGSLAWVTGVGSISDDNVALVKHSSIQNAIFVTGTFTNPLFSNNSKLLENTGNDDVFLLKYDMQGVVVWAKGFGSPASDYVHGMAINEDGTGLFLSGQWGSNGNFGTHQLQGPGQYVAHVDSNGNSKSASVTYSGSVSIFHESVLISNGKDSITFASVAPPGIAKFTPFNTTMTATKSMYMAQAVLSCKPCAMGYFSIGTNIPSCTACQANTYNDKEKQSSCIQCPLSSTSNPGSTSVGACSSCGEGSYVDTTVGTGTVYGSSGADDVITSITFDKLKNKYITGFFSSSITFGSFTLLANSSSDIFLAKMDANNNVLFAVRAGGTTNEYSTGVAVDTKWKYLCIWVLYWHNDF